MSHENPSHLPPIDAQLALMAEIEARSMWRRNSKANLTRGLDGYALTIFPARGGGYRWSKFDETSEWPAEFSKGRYRTEQEAIEGLALDIASSYNQQGSNTQGV